MNDSKKEISIFKIKNILIILWIIFSFIYIWYDLINKIWFQTYNKWYISAVDDFINNAINSNCKSFTINSWKRKAEVINVECFKNLNLINWQQTAWIKQENDTNTWLIDNE